MPILLLLRSRPLLLWVWQDSRFKRYHWCTTHDIIETVRNSEVLAIRTGTMGRSLSTRNYAGNTRKRPYFRPGGLFGKPLFSCFLEIRKWLDSSAFRASASRSWAQVRTLSVARDLPYESLFIWACFRLSPAGYSGRVAKAADLRHLYFATGPSSFKC